MGDGGGIPEALRNRVLRRMGLDSPPPRTASGLAALYGAWSAHVPFDNLRKMIALSNGTSGPLPGGDAEDFFTAWLEHGTSGTCWPSSNALCELLLSLGFEARRIACSMRDLGPSNHGSVKVRIDGRDWLADSSMLTGAPIPVGDDVYIHPDPVFSVELEAVEGTHLVWVDFPPNPAYIPCRILKDPVDRGFHATAYEASRGRSPFNQRLYARRNFPGEIRMFLGNTRVAKTARGLRTRELSAGEIRRGLVEEMGYSPTIVAAWEAAGGLAASLEPPSGPKPPPVTVLPPSKRGTGQVRPPGIPS